MRSMDNVETIIGSKPPSVAPAGFLRAYRARLTNIATKEKQQIPRKTSENQGYQAEPSNMSIFHSKRSLQEQRRNKDAHQCQQQERVLGHNLCRALFSTYPDPLLPLPE